MATRIKEKYINEAVPALQQKFGYKNVMEIPKLSKIVINMGLGDCKDNPKGLEVAVAELATISGQKPLVTKARKSIANFKLREEMPIGAKVTLRGDKMWERKCPCAAAAWKSSWISWSRSLFPAFATSAASATSPSTVAATTLWASVSS